MNTLLNDEDNEASQNVLDTEWSKLVLEAMNSGVSKNQFREFLEFNKWKLENENK